MKEETRFEGMRRAGVLMSREEAEGAVSALMMDERFAGLLGLLYAEREEWVRAVSGQDLAGNAGKLAHGMGSVCAVDAFVERLRGLEPNRGVAGVPEI